MSLPLPEDKDKFLKQAAVLSSIILAAVLMLLKLLASLYTGSLSILSSLIDSVSDIFASLISFVAVKFSSQPASRNHRYGFGKVEALSALMQSAFVAGSGIFIIYEGINRAINPQPLTDMNLGIGVMVFSLIATCGVIAFQKYVVRKTKSMAVAADSMHYVVDVLTNGSIIISLLIVRFWDVYWFDTLSAIFISVYLLFNAGKMAFEAVALLLDRELPSEIRDEITEIVRKSDFCYGVHDLRTRDLGGEYLFEMHLELDGNLTLNEAHMQTELIESEIKKLYPKAQIIIHQDPAGLDEYRLDNQLAD